MTLNAYSIIGLALCLFAGSACQSQPKVSATPPKSAAAGSSASSSLDAQLRLGQALLENGNHTGAIKQFAYVRDHAKSVDERDRAVVGLSMALQDSGKSGAALGALEPLPAFPETGLDAMKCVLAGELFLHQKKFGLAQTWLIRGLEVESESPKAYRSTALFNLGKALLADDHLEDALIAFEAAERIYDTNEDPVNAKQCHIIVADIRRALL